MAYFSGSEYHKTDDKNRIRIPSKFRGELGTNYSFVAGDQPCVSVYPKEGLRARFENTRSVADSDEKKKALRRIQMSVEDEIKEDNQGRVTLSPFFRRHLQLGKDEKDLVTIGMIDHLEIWNPSVLDMYLSDMDFTTAYKQLSF